MKMSEKLPNTLNNQKICTRCGEIKDVGDFSKRKAMKDGRRSQCKSCDKNHNDKYKSENKEAINIQRKKYKKAHPELSRKYKHERRARMFNNGYEDINIEYFWKVQMGYCQLCFSRIDRSLHHTDMMSWTLDHIIPLSKGGGHLYENIQLAHRICNQKKGSKIIERGYYAKFSRGRV